MKSIISSAFFNCIVFLNMFLFLEGIFSVKYYLIVVSGLGFVIPVVMDSAVFYIENRRKFHD